MKNATYRVDGMHCDGCAEMVKALLGAEEGVLAAEVSFEEREARVLFDPARTDETRIALAIGRPGYRAILKAGDARGA